MTKIVVSTFNTIFILLLHHSIYNISGKQPKVQMQAINTRFSGVNIYHTHTHIKLCKDMEIF